MQAQRLFDDGIHSTDDFFRPMVSKQAVILLVDDNSANRLALKQVLSPLNCDVVEADSGIAALRLLLDTDVAMILLDVQMPDMDGFETAHMIRSRDRSAHVPILFLTAFDKQEFHIKKGYSLGAVDYMFKPFDPEILRAKVNVFISLFEKNEQIKQQTLRISQLQAEARMCEVEARRIRVEAENNRLRTEQTVSKELSKRAEALARSNEDLEQFAYVASHDLQEPLRMVTSYCQLLKRRYEGQLDQDADEFIYFAVDGAHRMQLLINNLLQFSRINSQGKPFACCSLNEVMAKVLCDIKQLVDENKAIVHVSQLPTVYGDETQLQQVLQNLIINSIKFRSEDAPCIRVESQEHNGIHTISVSDNGIGIDEKYKEKIFNLFQRLDPDRSRSGSGIGLALCKRIVSRHEGQIWVKSRPDHGASFYFTLPVMETDQ